MSAKDEQYMHEINRLEGERDYWRSMHAKVDSECVLLRAKLDELQEDKRQRIGLWTCGCGTVNGVNLATCRVCGRKEGE